MQKEIRRVKTSNKRNYENLFTLHTTHEHDIEPPGWWNFVFKLLCFITYVSYCDLLKRILIGYFFTILHKKVRLHYNLMITWKLQSLQVPEREVSKKWEFVVFLLLISIFLHLLYLFKIRLSSVFWWARDSSLCCFSLLAICLV